MSTVTHPAVAFDRKPPLSTAACLVDAHVHLHSGFDQGRFLDHALRNFVSWGERLHLQMPVTCVLMLTELPGIDAFSQLEKKTNVGPLWTCQPTDEDVSLLLKHVNGSRITVVSGCQVATSEGLEVLALGTRTRFNDRRSIADTIKEMSADGALIVVPWGVGKWLGRRGRIIEDLISAMERFPDLCFGDNGNRPGFWTYPALLTKANELGRLVLPGSDPLPIAQGFREPGRFGFVGPEKLDITAPFAHLHHWLFERGDSPIAYGVPQASLRAISQQLLLKLKS